MVGIASLLAAAWPSADGAVAREPDPVAHDVAAGLGLNFHGAALAKTQGETPVFDYDGDGQLDILLSTHGGSPWPLLRNLGDNTFTEVLNGTFYQTDRHGCVVGDFGSLGAGGLPDGLPDLYCVTGACNGTCKKPYPKALFLQAPDHTFTDVAASWGVTDPHGRGRKAVTLDFDHDGLPDLAVANEGPSIFPTPNLLYHNLGGSFALVADSVVYSQQNSQCVTAADIDGDGWVDLLFCSRVNSAIGVVTYKNLGGTFADVTSTTAYGSRKAVDIEFADLNGDDRPDLILLRQASVSVWLNVGGRFPKANFTYPLGQGHDIAVGDVNLDGKPDIFVCQGPNNRFQHVMLINNGDGVSFHTLPLPLLTEGNGDVATAIPNWSGTGRAAFLVTNGRWGVAGPVELITFAPS